MKVFLPTVPNGRSIVICPGGSYAGHAIGHEGYDWVSFYNEKGITVAVLAYRLPHGDRSLPIADAESAIKIMRDSAEVWHLNPDNVGIMGSSAGGHLASTIATRSEGKAKPNFQILFYPVISMKQPLTHTLSHNNFLGETPSPILEEEYTNYLQVKADTPRAFIALSDDDSGVNPDNGAKYYIALHDAGVSAALHIYATGEHGWGFKPSFAYHNEMLSDLTAWLKSF
jgi:acetyl esterase/lipase